MVISNPKTGDVLLSGSGDQWHYDGERWKERQSVHHAEQVYVGDSVRVRVENAVEVELINCKEVRLIGDGKVSRIELPPVRTPPTPES